MINAIADKTVTYLIPTMHLHANMAGFFTLTIVKRKQLDADVQIKNYWQYVNANIHFLMFCFSNKPACLHKTMTFIWTRRYTKSQSTRSWSFYHLKESDSSHSDEGSRRNRNRNMCGNLEPPSSKFPNKVCVSHHCSVLVSRKKRRRYITYRCENFANQNVFTGLILILRNPIKFFHPRINTWFKSGSNNSTLKQKMHQIQPL